MKKSKYMTRALAHKDGRFAQILGRLGYVADDAATEEKPKRERKARQPAPVETKPDDDVDTLAEMRDKYFDVIGKRPFHGWDEEELQRRIDAFEEDE